MASGGIIFEENSIFSAGWEKSIIEGKKGICWGR